MTINTQSLREAAGNLKPPHLDIAMLLGAAQAYDNQAAEIARLRGLVTEMTEHGTYEAEYDGRMHTICHGCGAQDGEEHRRPDCLYVRARAALSQGD